MLIFINITGCTAKNAGNESDINTIESFINESIQDDETSVETEDDEKIETQAKPEDTIQNWDNMIYGENVLMRQAQADKVCIIVQPSVLRKYSFYYYIPEDEEQKWLQNSMNTLAREG